MIFKHVFSLVFLSVFGQFALGQDCNNLSVSLGPDILACNGTSVTLTASITGGPTGGGIPIFTWQFNPNGNGGTNTIQGATGSSYTIQNFGDTQDGTYTVTVTYAGSSCSESDNIDVDQPNGGNNNFDVDAGADLTICQGSNATINTSLSNAPNGSIVTYEWSSIPNIPGTNSNLANPTFSGLPTGSYNFAVTATATNNGNIYIGCDIVQVTVNYLNLDAGPDITICQGTSANINSTVTNAPNGSTVSYTWVSTPASANSSQADPSFSNLSPGITYTFTGTAVVNGCADTDQIQVVVNPSPTAPTFAIPSTGCPGVSVPISSFTPSAGYTYTWHVTPNSGTNLIGGNTSSPNLIFNNGGSYGLSVTATNSFGCSVTSSIQNISIPTIQVLDPFVEVASTPLPSNNYENTLTYTLCGNASSGNIASIYNMIPFGSNALYFFSNSTQPQVSFPLDAPIEIPLNIGNNYFTITGVLNGCSVLDTFNIYTGSNPYVAGGVSNSVGLCTGQTVNFTVSTINPSTNTPNTTGTSYTIGVSDVPTSLPNAPNSAAYATFFDLNGTQIVPYTFNSSSCGQNPIGYPANTFFAVIQAANACGTTTSTVSPIVVSQSPIANFNTSATNICVNSSVTLTNTGTSGNAITGPNNNAPFSCVNTGGYYYTITPTTGWTVSGSIGAPGFPQSNWGNITPASSSATVTFTVPGTYIITQKYQNACGTSTLQKTICVVPPPSCSFSVNPNNSCTPLVTNITNNTTGPSCGNTPLALAYNWSVANPAGGTSSIATATAVNPTITLNNTTVGPNLAALNFPITLVVNPLIPGTTTPVPNCSSTCNQTVTVYPQPSFISQPVQPPTVCLDGTFNALSVTVSYLGPGLPSYQWYSNVNPISSGGVIIPGATSSSYTPPATVVGTIYYYCVVTFPSSTLCSTITSNNIAAIVVPDPLISSQPINSQTICVGGSSAALSVAVQPGTGSGNFSYLWYSNTSPSTSGGIPISGATTSTLSPQLFSSEGTYYFYCTITDSGNGCGSVTSEISTVIVVPDPIINNQPLSIQTLCQNAAPSVLTVNASGGTGALQYQWYSNSTNSNTGGSPISGANTTSFVPPTNNIGTFYYYCLVTTPISGCSVASASSSVTITQGPIFTSQPMSSVVCQNGQPSQMCVTFINGTGTPQYQWYSNSFASTSGGVPISNANSNCFTPPSNIVGTTYYYCQIDLIGGGCNSILSDFASVIVNPIPIALPISDLTFCNQETTSLVLLGSNEQNTTFQWSFNNSSIGNLVLNGTGNSIPSFVALNNSTSVISTQLSYTPIYTNSGVSCSGTSLSFNIFVNPTPSMSLFDPELFVFCEASQGFVPFNSNIGGNVSYNYSNDNTLIGVPSTGIVSANENGLSFLATNGGNQPLTSNFLVTPVFTNNNQSCSGNTVYFAVTINPLPDVVPISSYTVCATQTASNLYSSINPIIGPGTDYVWTNTNPSIGMSSTGNGSNYFTSTNTSLFPISGTVSVTPTYTNNGVTCNGGNIAFDITVNPMPIIAPITSQSLCLGDLTNTISPSGPVPGTIFSWNNNNTSIGLPSSGTGAINSFLGLNNTNQANSATISYTPEYTHNNITCFGQSIQVGIIINPVPVLQDISNMEICALSNLSIPFLTTNNIANTVYQWTNSNTSIGLPSNGEGPISFLAQNSSSSPITSNISVTALYVNAGDTCVGSTEVFSIVVFPTPTISSISNQTICANSNTSEVIFQADYLGTNFNWSNTNIGIGLPASGSGNIPSFLGLNNGTTPAQGLITVTPTLTTNAQTCSGAPVNATITVNPLPIINPVSSNTYCEGDFINVVFSSNINSNVTYNWSNSNSANGLGNNGSGIINFIGSNNSFANEVSYFQVTPSYNNNGVNCPGDAVDFEISILPTPSIESITDKTSCNNNNINEIVFSSPYPSANYNWTNSFPAIGLGNSGTGNIPLFNGVNNSSSNPVVSTITVTPVITQSNLSCFGASETFNITILPTTTVNSISNQFYCNQDFTQFIPITGTGTSYSWTNDNTSIGLPSSGNSSINSFQTINNSTQITISNIEVQSSYTLNGVTCPGNSTTFNISVLPSPSSNVSPNITICNGVSVPQNLLTGNATNFSWTNSNSNIGLMNSGVGSIPAFTAINNSTNPIFATITYTPIISIGNFSCPGPTNSYTITVQASPTFVVQPIPSQTVCVDGTISPLNVQYSNGNGTPNYQWYSNTFNNYTNGIAIPNENASTFTPSTSQVGNTYYYCVVSFSGSGGCSMITSSIAEVVVLPDPTISMQPLTTQTICVGGSIPTPLSVNYSGGTGLPTYQWYNATNNTAIPGANSSSYTPPNFLSTGISDYNVAISLSGSGCDALTSANASVIVVADPTATISTGASYCQNAGSVVPISVAVSNGEGTSSYQWYSNTTSGNTSGTQILGANTSTYTPPVNQTGNVYYYCAVTQSGANCAVNSPTSLITVTPAPTFTTQPLPTQSVCVGGATTQLNVAYSNGTGTPTYQWYSNTTNTYNGGTLIDEETTSSFTPPSANFSTVYYYCIISFSADGGCSMISSNIAEVVVLPDPTITTQPLATQTICEGGSIPTPIAVNYSGGTGLPSYQWYNATINAAIPGANGSSYTPPNFQSTGVYDYYVAINLSGSGCDAITSANASVIVVADPLATISTGASYCQNAASVLPISITVSNGEGIASYQWYSNTTSGNTSGIQIIGANTSTYTPPVNQTGDVYYYCVVTQSGANCAVNSPTSLITVTPAPTFTTQPTPTQSVCVDGTTTQLNVAYSNGTGAPTYQWYSNTTNAYTGGILIAGQTTSSFTPSSASSGTSYYYCIISFSAAGGCSMITSNIAEVVVLPDPTISMQPLTTQTICVGGTVLAPLNVAYTGGVGTPTYQWFGTPAATIAGETNSSFTPAVFNSPGTYNYYVTIGLSGSGCDALTSANATVIVLADPIVSSQPTSTQSVCQNTATSQLSVSITGGTGTASYQWYSNTTNSNLGGTPIAGATLNIYTPASAIVGTQYYYCVITQTGTNCGVTSDPAAVVVNLAPIFSIQPINTQQHCLNQTTNPLQVAYSNGTGTPTYQWYVNNNNTISGGTPINLATSNTYSPPSNIDGTFYYYCVVSFVSGGGCPSITSNISEVIIHPYPIVTITGGETICLLESSDINFEFTPANGLYDITYTANGQSVTIDNYNGTNSLYTVTPSQTTNYVVTNIAYDQVPQCAIQPNISVLVNVNPLPALNQPVYTFCSDVTTATLQYTPDANNYTYNWLPNSSANYTGQTNGPVAINVTLPNPIGNAPTNYHYVTDLTNNATGCNALDSILITINPNPVGIFTLPSIGCLNSPIPLTNGDATIGNYEWSIDGSPYSILANPSPPIFNSLGNHTIELVAINQYGCTDTLNSDIQIYEQPLANFTSDTNYGCAPLEVNFTNLSTGQYINSYIWTLAPDTVSWNNTFSSSSLINPPTVSYLQGDTTSVYSVSLIVTNACGSSIHIEEITALPTPVANFTLPTHVICSGTSIPINDISVGEPTSYLWEFNNTISTNPNLNSIFFPSDSLSNTYLISLTLSNICGVDTFVDSVLVLPDNIQGGFTTSINQGCSPLNVTFTNTTFENNLSAIWHLDDLNNTVISNLDSFEFTYNAINNLPTNYNPFLVLTDGCAIDTIFTNISVFANPEPLIFASDSIICEGEIINFTSQIAGGGTGFYYSWAVNGLETSNNSNFTYQFNSGNNNGNLIPISLTTSAPNYTGSNCSNTENIFINVFDTPDLSQLSFNNVVGCSDLEVNLSNIPASTIIVNWGDGASNSLINHTYINNSASIISYNLNLNSSITYPTSPNLVCQSEFDQVISVYPTPLPVISQSTIIACEGQTIDFNASTANNQNTGVNYIWNIPSLPSSNNQNTTYTFNNGSATGANYPVELIASQTTLGTTCSDTTLANVTIFDTPDLSLLSFNNVAGCSDLDVNLTNIPASTINVNWGDGASNSLTNHTYINNSASIISYNLNLNSSITYPTSPNLVCQSEFDQVISVNPTPIPVISLSAIQVCEGQTIDCNASTANNQNIGVNYTWNIPSLASSNSQNTTYTFNNGSTTGTNYPVELIASQTTLGTTCSDTTLANVTIFDTPDLSLLSFNNVAGCSDLNVSVTNLPVSSNSINWGDGNTNFLTGHVYNNNSSNLVVYPVTITSTNSYGLVPNLNCVSSITQNISVYPSPLPQIFSSDINVCEGDNINLIASTANNQSNGITFFWDFGTLGTSNQTNTNLTLTYGSNTGFATPITLTALQNTSGTICSASVVDSIYVFDTPDLSNIQYSDINNCSPLLVSLSNLPTSTFVYNWGDGTTSSNPNHVYFNQGTIPNNYNITVDATTFYPTIPQLVCASTQNQVIQVNPQPLASFTMNPADGCDYTSVTTTLQNTSLNAIGPYQWSYDGNTYTTNNTNFVASFAGVGPHNIELVVSNQFGCTDSINNDFIVHELPTVTLNTIDDDLCLGATTEFVIDGNGISTSNWDFGDGISLNLLNPTTIAHYYSQPGTYSITAIVTNVFGCVDTVVFQNEVIIHPAPTSSFTTNTVTADIVYPYFEFYNYSVGGTNYYWNFGDSFWSNEFQPNHTYQTVGDYVVELTVSNEYNCFDVSSQVVHVEGIVVHIPNAFTPLDYNGVNDVFKPTFSSTEGIEFYEMIIYDRWGKEIFKTNDIDQAWIGNSRENDLGDANYYAQNDTYVYTVRYRKKARANDPQTDQIIKGHVMIIR